jgi:hypothetical protein
MKAASLVGQDLEARSYEDCLQEHLNPNSNAAGEIKLPTDAEKMKAHIRKSQAWGLKALGRDDA